jgi:glycosyltransferase involved in cell wall biosynthesis
MQLCLTLEHRFLQTPDKKIWTITQCPYDFYREYLEVFDSVRVISRAFPVERVEPNFLAVEGPGVEFYSMPGYKGPYEFISHFASVRSRARHAVPPGSAVILRLPSQVANSVEYWLSQQKHPYGVEVVADPYDVLGPAANRHPVAPIARRYFTSKLRRQCRQAVAVSYVTKTYLQQRYPPAPGHTEDESGRDGRFDTTRQYSVAVSDVNLSPESYVCLPRVAPQGSQALRIIFVGTLESLYKGPDVLLDAVGICKRQGVPALVRFLGIGQQIPVLQKQCERLGIQEQVEFVGSVTAGEPVRQELDHADLFVLPSRAEGVPRAMLEAMARGLPCIGTAVGGIPELLHQEDLVPVDDAHALAAVIRESFTNREKLDRMSLRNLRTAHNYSAAVLSEKRQRFFRAVKELTACAQSGRKHEYHPPLSTSVPAPD